MKCVMLYENTTKVGQYKEEPGCVRKREVNNKCDVQGNRGIAQDQSRRYHPLGMSG